MLLADLSDWGLVRRQSTSSGHGKILHVPADAATFYGRFLAQRGTPIDTVEEEIMKMVDGFGFSERHPTAAKALGEAFELVRRGVADIADLAEVGQHLRGALVDVVQSSAGLSAPEANVEKATKAGRKAAAERGDEGGAQGRRRTRRRRRGARPPPNVETRRSWRSSPWPRR